MPPGWRGYLGQPVLPITLDAPNRHWFGARPRVLREYRGPGVDDLIDVVDKAARDYPWMTTCRAFSGPDSNTFTDWIDQQVPEL